MLTCRIQLATSATAVIQSCSCVNVTLATHIPQRVNAQLETFPHEAKVRLPSRLRPMEKLASWLELGGNEGAPIS